MAHFEALHYGLLALAGVVAYCLAVMVRARRRGRRERDDMRTHLRRLSQPPDPGM